MCEPALISGLDSSIQPTETETSTRQRPALRIARRVPSDHPFTLWWTNKKLLKLAIYSGFSH